MIYEKGVIGPICFSPKAKSGGIIKEADSPTLTVFKASYIPGNALPFTTINCAGLSGLLDSSWIPLSSFKVKLHKTASSSTTCGP